MNAIENLKLAIFEASEEKLIDKTLTDDMLSFCESADLGDPDDVKVLESMCDTLLAVSESVNESKKSNTDSIKLAIFESEASGEITAEERDTLLAMM